MFAPDGVVPEGREARPCGIGADANSHEFCAGPMADALTFVSFPAVSRGRRTNRRKADQRREKSDLRQRRAIVFHAS